MLVTNSCEIATVDYSIKTRAFLTPAAVEQAEQALKESPLTITDSFCERSAGNRNEFYSEGDYWWPDTENPYGPYVRKDGETNPDNFVAHRQAMIRFSRIIGSLTSAYIITGDHRYANHALLHLNAWFVDHETSMKPHLLYAQAISGRVTGRGIGIIDTIHLIEVAQSVIKFIEGGAFRQSDIIPIIAWFEQYLDWLTNHPYGIEEKNATNNHGTCWVMQVASFAKLTKNEALLNYCRDRFMNVLLPQQMAPDGSFPLETRRTKPYGYSLFNLDAMAMICQILSDDQHNLWQYESEEGLSIQLGVNFLVPFVQNKEQWPFNQDVMYWDNWPVAHPFLIFSAIQYNDSNLFNLWKKLDHQPVEDEVIRNLPVRNPLIWL